MERKIPWAPHRSPRLILVVNTVAALVEKFFTQQVGAMYGEGNAAMISAMGKNMRW